MKYRPYGKTGKEASVFGMGCMRMPTYTDEQGQTKVDRPKAIAMIHRAIEGGVTYFDTAYVYHNEESESVVGEALSGGLREKVMIATKLPMWKITCEEDVEKLFNEELRRLQTDYIDVYLLHSLHAGSIDIIKKYKVLDFLDRMKAQGKIRHTAFSFHDEKKVFFELADLYPFDMCQMQLNILDINEQATLEGMRYAAGKGMAVVIMEPLRGGALANVPDDVQALYDAMPVKRSPAEWGFRFMYNFPEVSVILSGVSTMEQLEENLKIFDKAQAGCCDAREDALFETVRKTYDARIRVRCTDCKYCQPCPQGVLIPKIFSQYNDLAVFDHVEGNQRAYARLVQEGTDASACVACGACEQLCPQHIPIIEKLIEAKAVLEA
jgi:predicted aldo/keto reductase-like oxidoreductase